MERWLCERRTVHGDPEQIRERLTTDTVTLLQVATGSPIDPPAGDGSFSVVLASAGGSMHKTVSVTVGQSSEHGCYLRIPLTWRASPLAGAFPTFRGDIELEELDHRTVSVAVVGRYRPPASVLGDIADRIALGRNADAVVQRMVRGLATALGGDVTDSTGTPPTARTGHQVLVADVMSPDPLVLTQDTSLRTAASLMLLGRISGVPIVDEHRVLIGILSESDLLDKVAPPRTGLSRTVEMSWRRHGAVTVGAACSRPARTTSVDATIRDAAGVMAAHDVARLVVMRGATVVGILTRHDVLKALVRSDEAIEAAVEAILVEGGHDRAVASVTAGHVRLSGVVDLRTDAGRLPEIILELDGVLDVDASALEWTEDDVLTTAPTWF